MCQGSVDEVREHGFDDGVAAMSDIGLVDRFGVPWMVNTIPGADWSPAAGG